MLIKNFIDIEIIGRNIPSVNGLSETARFRFCGKPTLENGVFFLLSKVENLPRFLGVGKLKKCNLESHCCNIKWDSINTYIRLYRVLTIYPGTCTN
jgi:hypothetical protein